jgi:hypothetical protein
MRLFHSSLYAASNQGLWHRQQVFDRSVRTGKIVFLSTLLSGAGFFGQPGEPFVMFCVAFIILSIGLSGYSHVVVDGCSQLAKRVGHTGFAIVGWPVAFLYP